MKGSSGEMMEKVKALQMTLIQKDGVISLLNIQIEQFEEREVLLRLLLLLFNCYPRIKMIVFRPAYAGLDNQGQIKSNTFI